MGFLKNLLGGGNNGEALAKQQAAAAQRRSIAELARQSAEADQARAGTTGRKRGAKLLTFLGADGQASLG